MGRRRSGDSPGRASPVERGLAEIGRDRVRGASALTRAALDVLDRALAETPGRGIAPRRSELRRWAAALERSQPAMGGFLSLAEELRGLDGSRVTGAEVRRRLARWRKRLDRENARAARGARRLLKGVDRVVTLSFSDAVLRTLAPPRHPWGGEVVVLRSRPGGEGALLVRALKRSGVRARLVEDPDGPGTLGEGSALLVGADTVYRDGSLAHKVGTRRLARAAAARGTPVWVVSGRSKLTDRRRPPRALPARFDRTPARFVTLYATDAGILRPRELARLRPGRPARGRGGPRSRRSLSGAGRPSPRAS